MTLLATDGEGGRGGLEPSAHSPEPPPQRLISLLQPFLQLLLRGRGGDTGREAS